MKPATITRMLLNSNPCMGFVATRIHNHYLHMLAVWSILSAVFVILLLIAGYADSSFVLAGNGRGILEDPITHSHAFLIIGVYCVIVYNKVIVGKFVVKLNGRYSIKYYRDIDIRFILDVFCKKSTKYKYIYYSFVFLFVFIFIVNTYHSFYPEKYYGTYIWFNYKFISGFMVGRLALIIEFFVVLPEAIYCAFASVLITFRVAKRASNNPSAYNIDPHHEDRSGGFLFIGDLNITLLWYCLPVYIASIIKLYSMAVSDYFVFSIAVAGLVIPLLFVVLATYSVHIFLKHQKHTISINYYKRLKQSLRGKERPGEEAAAYLYLLRDIEHLRTWPLSPPALVSTMMPYAFSIATTIFTEFRQYFLNAFSLNI